MLTGDTHRRGRHWSISVERWTIRITLSVLFLVGLLAGSAGNLRQGPTPALAQQDIQTGAAPLDKTGDGLISYADVMETTIAWQLARESGSGGVCEDLPNPNLDIDGDGCITVADIQRVASMVGVPVSEPGEERGRYLSGYRTVDVASIQTDGTDELLLAQAAVTFVVNSTGDASDTNPGNGTCATSSGVCTLRAAIQEANLVNGPANIHFNIPGTGPHTIVINSILPTINNEAGGITIDGYTEPGSSPNTAELTSNADLMIEISGAISEPNITCTSSTCNLVHAMPISSSNNVIRGIGTEKVRRSIWMNGSGATNNVVAGSFIGGGVNGDRWMSRSYNVAYGIVIWNAPNNRIGGESLADRNVVAGNAQDGIWVAATGSNDNQIINNLVGLRASGTALANRSDGIDINGGDGGGPQGTLVEANVISGNFTAGIEISHSSNNVEHTIIDNFIGTNVSGTAATSGTANGDWGITLEDQVSHNVITGNVIAGNPAGSIHMDGFDSVGSGIGSVGNQIENNNLGTLVDGTPVTSGDFGVLIRLNAEDNTIGPDNVIAGHDVGVRIMDSAIENTITRNSIHGNSTLGIDLDPEGVNLNSAVTENCGAANCRRHYPEVESATTSAVTGTVCANCTVEVFIADRGAGEHGQGETFVGSASAAGNGSFVVPITGVSPGEYITTTATDPNGNTSEFSPNVQVTAGEGDTPPSVSIASPPNNSRVSGLVTVQVNASDADQDAGTLDVEVAIDGGTYQPATYNSGTGFYEFAWDTLAVSDGQHVIDARATDDDDNTTQASQVTVDVDNESVVTLPDRLEAEDYREGGQNVGYFDTTAGNTGGAYRSDDVDIETCADPASDSPCHNVGWIAQGEWLAFDVRFDETGDYSFTFRVATPQNSRQLRVELRESGSGDWTDITGAVNLANTGGWQNWTDVSTGEISITAGDYELRIYAVTGSYNINFVDVELVTSTPPAPTVSIVNPQDGGTVSGTTTIQVDASDDNDAVGTLDVEVAIDGGTYQTATYNSTSGFYELEWDTTQESDGSHTIDARATNSGNQTASAPQVSVTVENVVPPPTVDIVSPADASTVSGTVTVQVDATDENDAAGTLDVEVAIDGGTYQDASYNSGTGFYELAWDTESVSNGAHTIDARATNSAGQTANADQISVTVENQVPPPTIGITSPEDGSTVSGTVTIQVDASDENDATGTLDVEVAIDGGIYQTASYNGTTGFYELEWDTTQEADGAHTLDARATNSANQTAQADQISVTVDNVVPPPSVTIVNPEEGSAVSGTVTIQVEASDENDAAGTLDVEVAIDGGAYQAAAYNSGTGYYELGWDTTQESDGARTIDARATNSADQTTQAEQISVNVNNAGVVILPERIEAEDYREGGQNVGYFDTTAGNTGGAYRSDDVDIETCADAASGSPCHNVGWVAQGEWLAFDVRFTESGDYRFTFRVATPQSSRQLRVELRESGSGDWTDITGAVNLPNTGGWQNWIDMATGEIPITAGDYELRVFAVTGSFNLNFVDVAFVDDGQAPWNETFSLPGTIEAENYKPGGQNTGYFDTTAGNTGGAYRADDVDIEACSDSASGSTCHNVGWVAQGEWLAFDVNIAQPDDYSFTFRVASPQSGRQLRVELDSQDITGTVNLPNTGGWQTWQSTTTGPLSLAAGDYELRIFAVTGSFNINFLSVQAAE